MPSIGIMQGRLLPEFIGELQVFPISNWNKELFYANVIGFNYFELLYDKKMCLHELMQKKENFQNLGLDPQNNSVKIKSTSVCLDYFASISLIADDTSLFFLDELHNTMKLFKNSNIEILVIPFCEVNQISQPKTLRKALKMLNSYGIDKLAAEYELKISLELDLPANIITGEFSHYVFENIGICFDLGNIKSVGLRPESEILELNKLINHIHIKDRSIAGPNVMLGDGDVDFTACFHSLINTGYSGRFIMETRYFIDPIKEASENLEYFRRAVT